MHPGRGAFADREQARQAGAPVGPGGDPAHVIVGRRGDRDRGLARVQPGPHTGGEYGRKLFGEGAADRRAAIEERAPSLGTRKMNGPRHHIARLQIGIRRLAEQEPAVPVDQPGSLATQGFGSQGHGIQADVDGGRVKLYELRVENFRARAIGQRHTLAQQGGGGCGPGKQAARPAGRQHHGRGQHLDHPPRTALDQGTTDTTAGILDQTAQPPVFPDFDMRRGAHRRDQGREDGPPCPVPADPGDTGVGMSGFQADGETAGGVAVKRCAQRRQPFDRRRAVTRQGPGRLSLDQPGSRRRRIGRMQGGRVVRCQRRRHPALSPGRGTGLQQRCRCHHQHLARHSLERRRKPRQTAADDQRPVMTEGAAQRPNSRYRPAMARAFSSVPVRGSRAAIATPPQSNRVTRNRPTL